ncbi:MAG: 4-hydroxythreonine-4-phosphate dehydrogenase PdxA, partial [Clostridia bacterium]|nr:4-hydroxythreonine-4-phosphate dehydrogenase PdxA [Clostridia bacterium]
YDVIELSYNACISLGIKNPKIAVAGLNPHCGENGMFGKEEIEEITPAIEQAKNNGMCVYGPCPPDTVFSQAIGGWYDVVVCMYHDQGHIPTKVQGFVYNKEEQRWNAVAGVNITLGLPIVRTSVDHGTAFDHAGKGDANEISLINAIEYASKLALDKINK